MPSLAITWRMALQSAILLLLSFVLQTNPAFAGDQLAISGSFSNQKFEMAQGSSLNAVSVYVVVFNQGGQAFNIRMSGSAPAGVTLNLSDTSFPLAPAEQRRVLVSIDIGSEAVPGQYQLSVIAESYREDGEGIHVMAAAAQTAPLNILGESARATIQSKAINGSHVNTTLRLFKVVNGERFEVGSSNNGALDLRLTPGDFVAVTYIGSDKVGEETFSLGPNESADIPVQTSTVFFEASGAVPYYQKDSGSLGFVELVYTVDNVYQAYPSADVVLLIIRDGVVIDKTTLAMLAPMEKGRFGLKYSYSPSSSWQPGDYQFELQLKIGEDIYASSQAGELKVNATTLSSTSARFAFILIVVAIIVTLSVATLAFRMRRRRRAI